MISEAPGIGRNMLISMAPTRPHAPMIRKLPMPVRFFLVV